MVMTHIGFGFLLGHAQQERPCRKKEVPVISFKNLSPPYKDYDYFQCIHKYDFQVEATTFSMINAWWLSEVSMLAFADEAFVRSRQKKARLPKILILDKKSTQCFVASNDLFAIVAFRGSDIWTKKEKFSMEKAMADLKADIDIRLVDWPQGGKVHRGFRNALLEVWPDLWPYLGDLDRKGCKIWIAGHSLGGALATLCGSLLSNPQGIYTFGSPKVGNEEFKEQLGVKVYRIVNNDDIVSRLPLQRKYVHVGKLKFIGSDGLLGDAVVKDEPSVDNFDDKPYGQQFSTSPPNRNSFKGFIPRPFRDHVPLLYVINLWNNLIESQEGKQ